MGACNQKGCDSPGFARFTWPGQDEAEICHEHLPKLQATARAIGLHLEVRLVRDLEDQLDSIVSGITEATPRCAACGGHH